MHWLAIATFAYYLLAFESVANKYLITGKIKSWQLYLFYIGVLSAFSFLLAPFGLHWPGLRTFVVSFLAGMVFFGYLGFLFATLEHSAASRVFVLIGAVSTVVTFMLSSIFLEDSFSLQKIFGILELLVGGFFISFKFYKNRFFSGYKKAIIAGVLYAISVILLKYSYGDQNFVSGYAYSRAGIVAMTLCALLVPSFRRKVFSLLKKRKKQKNASQFGGVVAVKGLSGIATALLNYTFSIGNVTIISALVSVQYMAVFLLTVVFGFFIKDAFRENLNKTNLLMKSLGVVLIVGGVILVTL